MKRGFKKPWLAGLLSLFPFILGLGYLYIGLWKRFAIVFFLQLFTLAPMTWLGLREYNKYLIGLIWLFTLFDVYKQTQEHNREVARQSLNLSDDVRNGTH